MAVAPGRLVSEKLAGVTTPATDAVTLYGPPAVAFAVNTAEVATPLAFVVAVFTPPANVPLAPLAGALNVTATPTTGLPPPSFTVATTAAPNAVRIVPLPPAPLTPATLSPPP